MHPVSSLESVMRFLSRLKSDGLNSQNLVGEGLSLCAIQLSRSGLSLPMLGNDERIWNEGARSDVTMGLWKTVGVPHVSLFKLRRNLECGSGPAHYLECTPVAFRRKT